MSPKYPTSAAIDSLVRKLGLPEPHPFEQDWEYIVVDDSRIKEFIDFYLTEPLDLDEKFTLMIVIVGSCDDAVSSNCLDITLWEQVVSILAEEYEIHRHTIDYWSCIEYDLDEIDQGFHITALMRSVRDKIRSDIIKDVVWAEHEQAYYLVLQAMYCNDLWLNKDIKYLAVDLTDTFLLNQHDLIALIEAFCIEKGYILLLETFYSLNDKGYLAERLSRFEEGILITFHDIELKDDCLNTAVEKWRDERGARGADFTVKRLDDVWVISEEGNEWVS